MTELDDVMKLAYRTGAVYVAQDVWEELRRYCEVARPEALLDLGLFVEVVPWLKPGTIVAIDKGKVPEL